MSDGLANVVRPLLTAFALGGLSVGLVTWWVLRPAPPDRPPADLRPLTVPAPSTASDDLTAPTLDCYLGVVLARETVDVAAEIDGTLDTVHVRVGAPVSRGQVIAALDTASLDHQLSIERATLRTAVAERRRQDIEAGRAQQEHQRRLALQGLLSKEDEERARFQWQSAQATFEAADAEVSRVEARIAQLETRLERSAIRAPFDAVVSQRYLDPGAVVGPGAPILRLISAEGLMTRFAVPPDATSKLPVGTTVRVEAGDPPRPLQGVVEHVAPEIDAASQLIFLEARMETPVEGPLPPSGTAARVAALDAAAAGSCLVP